MTVVIVADLHHLLETLVRSFLFSLRRLKIQKQLLLFFFHLGYLTLQLHFTMLFGVYFLAVLVHGTQLFTLVGQICEFLEADLLGHDGAPHFLLTGFLCLSNLILPHFNALLLILHVVFSLMIAENPPLLLFLYVLPTRLLLLLISCALLFYSHIDVLVVLYFVHEILVMPRPSL